MPTLPPPSSLTLDRARKVDQRLSGLFESRRQNLAAIAHELAVMKRDGLYGYLGYSSVFAYAFERHGMGKSKVSELIGISEGSRELPQTREAFDSGKLPWTKAREVVKAATPETEVEWLERSTTHDLDWRSTALGAQGRAAPAPAGALVLRPDRGALRSTPGRRQARVRCAQ
jgi:hypothetical protein